MLGTLYYFTYSILGNYALASYGTALANAEREIALERKLSVFYEQHIQHFFLAYPEIIKLANLYYVTVHFVLPIVILILLFRRSGERFKMYRNVFAILTALAFLVYLVFPVAPPRLLPHSFGFVETQQHYGGAGQFDAYLMKESGDPYAAMPSLHFAWALWCSIAGYKVLKSKVTKTLLWLHPFITIFVVVITANHFFVDIVAGAVAVVISQLLAGAIGPLKPRWWRQAPQLESGEPAIKFVGGIR